MSPLAARVKVRLHVTSPPPLAASPLPQDQSTPDQSIIEDAESEISEDESEERERSHVSTGQDESEEGEEEEVEEPNATVNTTDEMRGSETINDESNEDDPEDVEGTLGSLREFIADTTTETDVSPNATYEEEVSVDEGSGDDEEEEPEADADDDRFPPSPSDPTRTPSSAPQHYATPVPYEKENVVPTKEEDGPSREADEFGFFDEKSQVIQTGSKSSKKR